MKKITYVLITALILSLCLGITSFAMPTENSSSTNTVKFSEDFRTMYYKDYEFHQKNVIGFHTYVLVDYEDYEDYEIAEFYADSVTIEENWVSIADGTHYTNYELSDSQKNTVDYVEIFGDDIIVNVTVYYKDGTSLMLDLLRDEYMDDYEALKSGKYDNYQIEYDWPEDNTVNVTKEILTQNPAETINIDDYNIYDYQNIYLHNQDGTLSFTPGYLVTLDESNYYLDLNENNIKDEEAFYEVFGLRSKFTLHKITDDAVLEDIRLAEEAYYEDDYGYLYNDKLANTISFFFLIVIFGIIPGIIFVISLVFAIIKKKTYRKLLFATSFFTLAEIIVFIIFMVITNFK